MTDIRMPPGLARRRAAGGRRPARRTAATSPSWCSASTCRPSTPPRCWTAATAGASATCSRTGSPRSPSSPSTLRTVAGGGTVVDPDVVRQLLHRPPRPARRPVRPGARGAGAARRGAVQRGDRRAGCTSPRRPSASTSATSWRSSTCRPATTPTAGCWRPSPTCARARRPGSRLRRDRWPPPARPSAGQRAAAPPKSCGPALPPFTRAPLTSLLMNTRSSTRSRPRRLAMAFALAVVLVASRSAVTGARRRPPATLTVARRSPRRTAGPPP